MAPPQCSVDRRSAPNLAEEYGRHWPALLERQGYFYVGKCEPGTLRVPAWRPDRVVAVDPDGHPSVWENACRHHGLHLIPASDDLKYHPWNGKIKCPWHAMEYGPTGEVKTPGLIRLRLEELPERACPKMETFVWQGLIFELGQATISARSELEESLGYVTQVAGEIFDFRDYKLERSVCAPQRLENGETADAHTSIDNFLDVTHVPRHEKTLSPLVDIRSTGYSYMPKDKYPDKVAVQFMDPHRDWQTTEFGRLFLECDIPVPACGAAWVTTRMGLMLEYYPGVIVVSQCFPHPERWWECTFYHDFYYHKRASEKFINCHQGIFDKTGLEDLIWCSGATRHIRNLIARGRGGLPWGLFDRRAENFGKWYSDSVRELLQLK